VPEGARFCPSCGHPLLTLSDERRVVTVLFGDLVGFTALSETRDPEQVKNIVDRCFERLAADITSYGGRVDKIIGDAVVALFGAPVAHEDDAERAVRAALAMQRTIAEMTDDLGAPIRMRIGINTGEVLVGALRAGGDYTAMGDVVNIASRLQTTARPGEVVVGTDTWAATRGVVRYESLGGVQARGRGELVPAWRAVEVVTPPGRRPRRLRGPLVGRSAEMAMLCNALTASVTYRRPYLALVSGEAGMGKSRLVEEIVEHARDDHGALVMEGRSVPYGEANVWWPLAEALAGACGIEFGEDVTGSKDRCRAAVAAALGLMIDEPEVERTADALLYLMGFRGALSDVDTARAREEVSRAVRTFIEGLASKSPVVLSIADVQWSDRLVLELIDDLLDRLHRLPIVVLLTARPDVAERWQPRPGRHNLVVLNLDPLEASAASELLGSLLGTAPGDDVATLLIERSGGNPFFIEELVALLTEAATVSGPSEALADLKGAASLPATLRGLVAARLDALPAEERGVLEDAAVLGRRGPVTALEALADARGLPHVGPALEALEARDLLSVQNGSVGFGSDLVREVAYGILTKAERARRHARLAAWLDTRPEGDRADELLEELSRHAALAAELTAEIGHVPGVPLDIRDRAVAALEQAATRADDRETHLVTARLYDQVLRLLGEEDGPARRHALIGRARAHTALWQHDAARADLEVAMSEAREAGDELVVARALTVLGELEQNEGDVGASMSTLGEAVALWRRLGDRRGEASALRRQGMTSLFAGDPDAAEDSIGEALVAFQAIGSRKGIAWANQNLAWIAFTRGDVALADERLDAAIALFGDIGDWGGLGWAQGLQAYVRYSQGGVVEAEAIALRVLEEAGERGAAFGVAMMTVLLASIRLWQGHAEEAVERASAAKREFAAVGDVWGECRAIGPLSHALLVTGRRAEAEAALSEARELTDRLPEGSLERDSAAVMAAELAAHMGEGHLALAYLCATDDLRSAHGAGGDREVAPILGTALVQSGRFEDALTVLRRAAERSPGRPAIEAALVLTHAALGNVEQARRSAEAVAATGWASYLDRVVALLGLACAETRTGGTGEALAAIEEAAAIADGTDDILTGGIVALARSRVLEAAGAEGGADVALADADSRLARIGIDAAGWDDLFRVATGTAAVA
jgi:class 3 adenylate cyclase/tetratricopeptide (TPR) repeat protein